MSKLNWTPNDTATTDTHSYRIELHAGGSVSVIYGRKGEQQMQYNGLDSVEAAKQWAQNYNNQFGGSDE